MEPSQGGERRHDTDLHGHRNLCRFVQYLLDRPVVAFP